MSIQQVRIFRYIQQAQGWVTARDIAKGADVAERTARSHAFRLVRMGILDEARVFPGHRYRLADKTDQQNSDYLQQLEETCKVFDL